MFGLLLASIMSVFNVFTDVSRKKVLDKKYNATLISFWCKFIATIGFGISIIILMLIYGAKPQLPDISSSLNMSPALGFLIYMLLTTVLEGTAVLLYLRALQVSPISYCMPFMALTPLFLLPAGSIFLKENISYGMIIGVFIVVIGSFVVNRQLFAKGLFEPVCAIFREKGSRYMVIVAFLLTITNVLDKWFVTSGTAIITFDVRVSRALTLSIGKSLMMAVFFFGLTIILMGDWKSFKAKSIGLAKLFKSPKWCDVFKDVPTWLILAGLLEAVVLLLQLVAMQYTVAALVISIKRAGIVLAVALGWFIFKERGITDRIIASCVMLAGVIIFFLTKPGANNQAVLDLTGAIIVAVTTLVGMGIALYVTRKSTAKQLS